MFGGGGIIRETGAVVGAAAGDPAVAGLLAGAASGLGACSTEGVELTNRGADKVEPDGAGTLPYVPVGDCSVRGLT